MRVMTLTPRLLGLPRLRCGHWRRIFTGRKSWISIGGWRMGLAGRRRNGLRRRWLIRGACLILWRDGMRFISGLQTCFALATLGAADWREILFLYAARRDAEPACALC